MFSGWCIVHIVVCCVFTQQPLNRKICRRNSLLSDRIRYLDHQEHDHGFRAPLVSIATGFCVRVTSCVSRLRPSTNCFTREELLIDLTDLLELTSILQMPNIYEHIWHMIYSPERSGPSRPELRRKSHFSPSQSGHHWDPLKIQRDPAARVASPRWQVDCSGSFLRFDDPWAPTSQRGRVRRWVDESVKMSPAH